MKTVEKGVTPRGTFQWAWLDKPDTKFDKSKYKVTIILEKGVPENDAFAKRLNDLHKAAKGNAEHRPAKDGDALAEDDEKKERFRGHWVVTFKTKNKPELRGPGGKNDVLAVAPRSGDYGRVAYAVAESGQGSAYRGVILYLNAVQLLERRAVSSGADMFEDESDEFGPDTARAESDPDVDGGTDPDDDASDF
ncbi:DUF2815 family protein [Caldimonas thermodepolymerans]|nr:ssDNA-binding protein [Caldimonas thermodepolymerans]QPC30484.1 DUF2815 family protein [Caldimonas thermodepolymerans]